MEAKDSSSPSSAARAIPEKDEAAARPAIPTVLFERKDLRSSSPLFDSSSMGFEESTEEEEATVLAAAEGLLWKASAERASSAVSTNIESFHIVMLLLIVEFYPCCAISLVDDQ
mmetsp:Transcript_5396/g.11343  ORF Transcript_5396/g.11343 Transcript_5396/m.11343 type:complete len:114 (-) Transcript_5396:4-345(-)